MMVTSHCLISLQKINADLSNDLGNLLNRTIAMIEKYHGGVDYKMR